MVHSSQDGPGRPTARRRVPPETQPLRPAIALAIITLVTLLLRAAGVLLAYVFVETWFFEGALWDLDMEGEDLMVRLIVLGLAIFAFVVADLGLKLASLILGLLVVIRGDGKLRIGGALLLAIALFGLVFSLWVDVPSLSGTLETVLVVLQWAVEILRWVLMICGVVLLGLGIREVRQARRAGSWTGVTARW